MKNPDWTTIKLNEGERVDDLERCGYKIIQNPEKFCFGIDAVLLSGFANVKKGEKALDLCSGNGIIPILLAGKYEGASFDGIEIQEDSVDLANRSIVANGTQVEHTLSIFFFHNITLIKCFIKHINHQ